MKRFRNPHRVAAVTMPARPPPRATAPQHDLPSVKPAVCPRPASEVLLTSIISGLLLESRVPPGVIIDSGAHRGLWACHYAEQAPYRLVFAIDPDEANILFMRSSKWASALPNLHPFHGALGAKHVANMSFGHAALRAGLHLYPKQNAGGAGGREKTSVAKRPVQDRRAGVAGSSLNFSMHRIDDLFAKETVGLMQLDVEGFELAVLQGSAAVIQRDQPIITTEVEVHGRPEKTRALLALLSRLQYDSWLIEEIVGTRADLRNLLHIPRSRLGRDTNSLKGSNTLDLAVAARALVAVDAATIGEYAFPCCRRGRECCPAVGGGCCAHYRVHAWMNSALRNGSLDLGGSYFTRSTWYDNSQLVFKTHGAMMRMAQYDRDKADLQNRTGMLRDGHGVDSAGFSYYVAGLARRKG